MRVETEQDARFSVGALGETVAFVIIDPMIFKHLTSNAARRNYGLNDQQYPIRTCKKTSPDGLHLLVVTSFLLCYEAATTEDPIGSRHGAGATEPHTYRRL